MEFQEIIELEDKPRTCDVKSNGSFEELMISPTTIENMYKYGFKSPSPVQEKAIPAGLTGLDILVQAKSGTGKTLVFSVLTAENLNTQSNKPQRMILAPTREIATQIRDTVKRIAHHRAKIAVLVGGTPLSLDIQNIRKGAHVIIGTTGRICQLVQGGHLNLDNIDLFVLDEADKLMEDCFKKDINYLFSCLPSSRQVAVFSATYPRGLDSTLAKFMRDATLVRLNADDVQLVGIKQYVVISYSVSALTALEQLLKTVTFNQALVFCNFHKDCEPTCSFLEASGFSASYISSQMTQDLRDKTIEQLKHRKIKILVSTDLTARGIDAENVNLVVNIGAAMNAETYFHRIGRAARFGGLGAAVTLLEDGRAVNFFAALVRSGGDVHVNMLSLDDVPSDLTTNKQFHERSTPFTGQKTSYKKTANSVELNPNANVPWIPRKDGNYEDCSYDRDTMYQIRQYVTRPSAVLQQKILDTGVGIGSDFSIDLQQLTNKILNEKGTINTSLAPKANDAPKRPKFVPSRSKAKTKFYMRGELVSIRDSFSSEVWKNYAETKFDLTSEPFLGSVPAVPESCPETSKVVKNKTKRSAISPTENEKGVGPSKNAYTVTPAIVVLDSEPTKYSCSTSLESDIKRYSRKQMVSFPMKASKEAWLSYVRSKWDTSEEPWQLDPHLRCSFEEQLRRIRLREKQQRAQVMAARQKAVSETPLLTSSSRYIGRLAVTETSFESFCANIAQEYNNYTEPEKRTGPVVPQRDSRSMWHERTRFYSDWVAKQDSLFRYDVSKTAKLLAEVTTDTDDLIEEGDQQCPSTSGGSVRSTDVVEVQLPPLSTMLPDISEEPSVENSHLNDDLAKTQSLRIPDDADEPCCSHDKQYADLLSDEESKEEDQLDSDQEHQYESEDDTGVVEYALPCSSSEIDRLSQFADNYRRNVDFSLLFSTYLSLLNGR